MKISSLTVFKILTAFSTVLALGAGGATYFSYKLSQQAQNALSQQIEELNSAGAKIKELEEKIKDLETKNSESAASLDKFSNANKELTTQLEELNKQLAEFEAIQKRAKQKAKLKS